MLFAARTMGSGMATYFPVIRGTRRRPCLVVPARAKKCWGTQRNFPTFSTAGSPDCIPTTVKASSSG